MDIEKVGHSITLATCEMWGKVMDKFGKHMADTFMKNASLEQKETFVKDLKDSQMDKLNDRLTLIFNRVLTDLHFVQSYNELMRPYRTLEELKRDLDITNNHLQSVENESSTLQRDIDTACDKLESLSEEILENKLLK